MFSVQDILTTVTDQIVTQIRESTRSIEEKAPILPPAIQANIAKIRPALDKLMQDHLILTSAAKNVDASMNAVCALLDEVGDEINAVLETLSTPV